MKKATVTSHAKVPMQTVGPIKIVGEEVDENVMAPLATYESPLWPSVARGAKVSVACGGINAVVVDERMSRSILIEAPNAEVAAVTASCIRNRIEELRAVVRKTSRFAHLMSIHTQVVANLIYARLEISTGDAAGHNMVTNAADKVINWILKQYSDIRYVSISGNYCTDKKASAVNGILGRGKYVVTEITIPKKVCSRLLRTTPEQIVDLNIKKNLIGTMLAGGLRSANAHFANMLLAFYLATGQDAANIIEGSQGFVHAEVRPSAKLGTGKGDLYFSATLPNLIVGTVGSGKDIPFVKKNLKELGCLEKGAERGHVSRFKILKTRFLARRTSASFSRLRSKHRMASLTAE